MSAPTPALREFLDAQMLGVLATSPPHGHPRQSVGYYVRENDRLLISSVAGRRKVSDVEETGWASLCVMGLERPFPSATFSGPAEVLAQRIGAASAALAQRFTGAAESPEILSDEALAAVGRVILAIAVERVSAVSHLEG